MLNYISRFHVLTTLVAVFGIGCDDTTDTTGMVGNGLATPCSVVMRLGCHQHLDCRIISKILDRPGDNGLLEWLDAATRLHRRLRLGRLHPLLGQGEGFRQRRNDEGQWALEGCPEGTVCEGSDCAAPPERCVDGETQCLSTNQVGVCENGEWVNSNECPEGQACANGMCSLRACAAAEASNSYLGCDYLAVDLPNAAFDPNAGSTRESPLGVVLGNPDSASPVKVTVYGPNGELANLVGETTVTGQAMGFNPIPPSETIRSEVRDANDMVVASGMMTADELEVPAGGTAVILLPRRMGPLRTSSIRQDAYRIKSSAPVALFNSAYCCNFSVPNDAILFRPVAQRTDMSAPPIPIRTQPAHRTARHRCRRSIGCNRSHSHSARRCCIDITAPIQQMGDTYRTLNAQDVLLDGNLGRSLEDDLTGADIVASRPVAVFSTRVHLIPRTNRSL